MNLKITETEDYNVFASDLIGKIRKWEASKKEKPERKQNSVSSVWESIPGFHLHGEAGTGKSKYLDLFFDSYNGEIIKIKNINDIKSSHIYLFDAVNESTEFDQKDFEQTIKRTGAFVISSSWDKMNLIHSYEINPDEATLKGGKWNLIKEKFKVYDFSIRDKTAMNSMKNYSRIKNKQPHEILWKSFENVFDTDKQKEDYKILAYNNPISPDRSLISKESYDYFVAKHIIQFNKENWGYVFSHPEIANHLYLRNKKQKIESFSFDMEELSYIKANPSSLIWWSQTLRIPDAEIYDRLLKSNASIRVENYFQLGIIHHEDDHIAFRKLKFIDISLLVKNNLFQRAYKEYLNENIDTKKELTKKEIDDYDLAYFIFIILSPMRGDDLSPEVFNSMKFTYFIHKIKIDNSNNRYKMLNFLLFKFYKHYIDEDISPLLLSDLRDIIYSRYDQNNKITFHDFIKKCWEEEDRQEADSLDDILDAGPAHSDLLDFSHIYSDVDKDYKMGRNNHGGIREVGHRSVNLFLYKTFERPWYSFSRTNKFRVPAEGPKIYTDNVTPAFIKLGRLMFTKFAYYFKNLPVNKNKFDISLPFLKQEIVRTVLSKNKEKISKEVMSFLKDNKKLVKLDLTGDPNITNNGTFYLWLRRSDIKSPYDPSIVDGDIISGPFDYYQKGGLKFRTAPFNKVIYAKGTIADRFVMSIKSDDLQENYKVNDYSAIIDLEKNTFEYVKYFDPYGFTSTNEDSIEELHDKYEDELLPFIKRGIEENNKQ